MKNSIGILGIIFVVGSICVNVAGISFAANEPVASNSEREAPAGVSATELQTAQDAKAALVDGRNSASSYACSDTGTNTGTHTETDTSTDTSTDSYIASPIITPTDTSTKTYTNTSTNTSTNISANTSTNTSTVTSTKTSTNTNVAKTPDKTPPLPPTLKEALDKYGKFMKSTDKKPSTDTATTTPSGTITSTGTSTGGGGASIKKLESWILGNEQGFLDWLAGLFANRVFGSEQSDGPTKVTVITETTNGKAIQQMTFENNNTKVEMTDSGSGVKEATVTNKNDGSVTKITDTNSDGVGDKSTTIKP